MKYKQREKKWFAGSTPVNAVKASQTIGSGDNGTVTVTYGFVGDEGNVYTIEVVEGTGADVDMTAVLTGTAIVVTLGTDSESALDATKNTATLVAAAIDELANLSAEASGTGETALAAAEAEASFTGGQYATQINDAGYIIISGTCYISDGCDKWDEAGWKSATPTVI